MTKPVTGLTVFGSNTSGTTTQLDNNFSAITTALNDLNTYPNFLTDIGSANAVIVNLAANITGAITNGLVIQVKILATNTGPSTLNYNSGGALNILNQDGSALTPGQLQASGMQQFEYRSSDTSWILQTPFSAGTEVLLLTRQANANTSIDFNALLSSTFDNYIVRISNAVVACQNASLLMRFAHSAGNYISSAANYAWSQISNSDGSAPAGTGNNNANGIQIAASVGNGTNAFLSSTVNIFGASNTTVFKGSTADSVWRNTTTFNVAHSSSSGVYSNSNTAIVSVQFVASTGNISSGNFSLYGVRK